MLSLPKSAVFYSPLLDQLTGLDARAGFVQLLSILKLIWSEKNNVSILEFCYVIKNKSTFPNENVGNALTNDRKSKEISNNFSSRRH